MATMSPQTESILDAIKSRRYTGVPTRDLVAAFPEYDPAVIRKAVNNLRDLAHVVNLGTKASAIWVASQFARRDAVAAYSRAEPSGNRVSITERSVYNGAELRPNPGMTPDRMDAYRLPSRMGNRLHYPDGRVESVV